MRTRPGFSLVEVLVALVVFAIGAMGAAAAISLAARAQRRAAATREAVAALRLQLGTLAAVPCDSLRDGNAMVGAVPVSWSIGSPGAIAAIEVRADHRGQFTSLKSEVAC